MKMRIWLLLPLIVILFLTGCSNSRASYVRVRTLPQGFVLLRELTYGRDYIGFFPWHEETAVVSPEGSTNTIFFTAMQNSDFIVIHNNRHYVNEEIMLEVLNHARNRDEIISRRYALGEPIEISPIAGLGETREFTIHSAERIEQDERDAVYEIKFDINPPPSTLQEIRRCFISVETIEGRRFDSFDIVDENTIHIRIRNDNTISTLTITNLSSVFFEGHRRTICLLELLRGEQRCAATTTTNK